MRPRRTRRSTPCSRASPRATSRSPRRSARRKPRNCAAITPRAADLYDKLSSRKSVAPEDVLSGWRAPSLAAGDRKRAAEAFQRVYYEFPLSDAASTPRDALGSLQDFVVRNTPRDLGRALILFGAKRYSEARSALQDLAAPGHRRRSGSWSICASPRATISSSATPRRATACSRTSNRRRARPRRGSST